jgi:hypothetical protein
MRLDEGKREGLGRRSWGRCGGAAMPDGGELAGVTQSGTTGHGSTNREHWEREETKANSHRGIGMSGKGLHGPCHDRRRKRAHWSKRLGA